MRWVERRAEIEPDDEVRIADEWLAEGDHVGAALRERLLRALLVEAVIGDDEPSEQLLDGEIVERGNGRAARVALDHMQIGQPLAGERRGDVVEEALRIAVGDVVLTVLRRDAHARAV